MKKQVIFWDKDLRTWSKQNAVCVHIYVDGWMDKGISFEVKLLLAASFDLEMCQI